MPLHQDPHDNPLVGRGLAFPLNVGKQGGFMLTHGDSELVQSIQIILTTTPGERVMRPTFGSRLKELLFEPINNTTATYAESYVEDALAMWEPRIIVTDVQATPEPDAGRISIDIAYSLKATNDKRSLVFPFYVIPESE